MPAIFISPFSFISPISFAIIISPLSFHTRHAAAIALMPSADSAISPPMTPPIIFASLADATPLPPLRLISLIIFLR
jgi:hypothetical protein